MLIRNIKLTVTEVADTQVTLMSELRQKITIAKDLLEKTTVGDILYLAADDKPLTLSSAKDILNELINGQESAD